MFQPSSAAMEECEKCVRSQTVLYSHCFSLLLVQRKTGRKNPTCCVAYLPRNILSFQASPLGHHICSTGVRILDAKLKERVRVVRSKVPDFVGALRGSKNLNESQYQAFVLVVRIRVHTYDEPRNAKITRGSSRRPHPFEARSLPLHRCRS